MNNNIIGSDQGANVVPGMVLEFFDDIANTPKTKKVVVVALAVAHNAVFMVYINSKPVPVVNKAPTLMKWQHPFLPDARRIVRYPSYIDCTVVKRRPLGSLQEIVDSGKAFRKFMLTSVKLALML